MTRRVEGSAGRATIRDVAQRAGVSSGTVSNVLNRPSYVNDQTRQRVLDAIDELGFVPTDGARRFRPGRERALGFAMANMGNPFFVDVALGAESKARELGAGIVFCNSGYDPVRQEQGLDLLIQQRVQGVMISPVEEDHPALKRLMERGVPVVFVDRVSRYRDSCWVVGDDFAGGRLAAEHLLESGHTSLGYAGHPQSSAKVRARLEGVESAVSEASSGDPTVEMLEIDSWTVPDGRDAGEALAAMSPHDRPTGVICANDLVALGMLQELNGRGIKVPEDMAIVGYDDLEWAAVSTIPLTTIRQPRAEMGRLAVELLLLEINEGSAHQHQQLVLDPELIVRDTT